MGEDRIRISELLTLVAVFGGPAYIAASALQLLVLTRAGLNRHGLRQYIFLAELVSLLSAFPLTIFFWWSMHFLSAGIKEMRALSCAVKCGEVAIL